MSKEFQIRDGNLIASFNLENEDGDIDFCKLLKVSHGVVNEIGMFVDYIATNKIIKDQSKKIADLEAKLAESEKKAYSRGHSQRDIANEIKLNALREDVANKEKRIVELKQQLAEKEKEMSIKSIIRTLVKYNNLNCTFRDKTNSQIQQCGDVYNSNYGYFNFEDDYDECLNNRNDSRFDIISIDLDNQDKISFAIEQLEQLKKLCQEKFNWWENSEWEGNIYDKSDVSNAYFDIEANIDQQIASLKKGVQ